MAKFINSDELKRLELQQEQARQSEIIKTQNEQFEKQTYEKLRKYAIEYINSCVPEFVIIAKKIGLKSISKTVQTEQLIQGIFRSRKRFVALNVNLYALYIHTSTIGNPYGSGFYIGDNNLIYNFDGYRNIIEPETTFTSNFYMNAWFLGLGFDSYDSEEKLKHGIDKLLQKALGLI